MLSLVSRSITTPFLDRDGLTRAQPLGDDGKDGADPALWPAISATCARVAKGHPSNVTKVVALLLVAVSVGLDNFGASAAIGVSGVDRSLRFRVALIFGVFEAAMPVIGLLLGRSLVQYLGSVAKPLGGGLLVLAGTYAICTELIGGDQQTIEHTELSMRRLVLIGLALSIDNLVIGFALGAYHVKIVIAAVIIALISVRALSAWPRDWQTLGRSFGKAGRAGWRRCAHSGWAGHRNRALVGIAVYETGHDLLLVSLDNRDHDVVPFTAPKEYPDDRPCHLQLHPPPPYEGQAGGDVSTTLSRSQNNSQQAMSRPVQRMVRREGHQRVGTMWCAYAFAALALISLPQAISSHNAVTLVSWVSQTFLQLVLLSVIIVGQNVLAAAADKRPKPPTTMPMRCCTRQ